MVNDVAVAPQSAHPAGDTSAATQGVASFSQVLQEHSAQEEAPIGDQVAENMESSMAQLASLFVLPVLDVASLTEVAPEEEALQNHLAISEKKPTKFDPDLILGLTQKDTLASSEGDFKKQLAMMGEKMPLVEGGDRVEGVETEDLVPPQDGIQLETAEGENVNVLGGDELFESQLAQGEALETTKAHVGGEQKEGLQSKTALPLPEETLVEALNFIEDKPKIKNEGLSESEDNLNAPAETPVTEVTDETHTQGHAGKEDGANQQENPASLQKNADKKVADSTVEKNVVFKEVASSVAKDPKVGSQPVSDPTQASVTAVSSLRQEPIALSELITTPPANRSQQLEQFLARGIEKTVQFLKEDGVAQARIVVDPPALGRVDISLSATDKGIEALIRVDNEALKQAVQSQLDQLRQNLADQGIQAASLSVDIRHGDDKGRNVAQSQKKLKRSFVEEEEEEQVSMVRLDLEKGLLHWVA